jgi:hypothetical protein
MTHKTKIVCVHNKKVSLVFTVQVHGFVYENRLKDVKSTAVQHGLACYKLTALLDAHCS